jgi:signal transduction histidine kinase
MTVSAKNTHHDDLLGLFASEIAHELARPLTRILNEQAKLKGSLQGRSHAGLSTIEREVRRCAEILDGFSMLSREQHLQRIPVELGTLIRSTAASMGLKRSTFVNVKLDCPERYLLPANLAQLKQVFTNVIQNACEAMTQGGQLSIRVRAQDFPEAGYIITFQDTGPGIPPDIQSKLFEPFFTTKRTRGGRGVGLTLSRAMIERHGGVIRIESPVTAGGGTRVVVSLPLPKEDVHGS